MEIDDEGVLSGLLFDESVEEDTSGGKSCSASQDINREDSRTEKLCGTSQDTLAKSCSSRETCQDTRGGQACASTKDSKDNANESCEEYAAEAVGYVHNISPLKRKGFIEFQVQTKERVLRAICVSPNKRKEIEAYRKGNNALKIKRFKISTQANSEDMIISENTMFEVCQEGEVGFQKEDLPETIKIAMINNISTGQLISVRAKVVHVNEPNKVKSMQLSCQELLLVDPTGSIKLVLWEDFINTIEKGCIYLFKDVRIKRNPMNQQIFLNTAKSGSSIVPDAPITEVLPITEDMTEEFANLSEIGYIIGVDKDKVDF